MTGDELRARQAPLKAKYKEEPAAAQLTLKARATLGPDVTAVVETARAPEGRMIAGLHPATAGTGAEACSGDMLLQALVGCAGVTLGAVSTAMGIVVRAGAVLAEGDLDFRGTLGVSKETPVGFSAVRLRFELDTDATDEQLAKLGQLTERYCVVAQTIRAAVPVTSTTARR
ncbi:MAG TPA: OsmC family protein [Polyangia bacterium]|nr:OsmC family protein [Polyangia bacterium]